jgi:hypothetical protein
MLTEEQVVKARTFPGCDKITAENAVDKLYAAAESLAATASASTGKHAELTSKLETMQKELATAQAAIPQPTPAPVLKAMASAARIHKKSAVEKQAITPAAADLLASVLIGEAESPSATGLVPNADGECLASIVFGALASNGAAPNVGKAGSAQPAPRIIAGKPETDDLVAEARAETAKYQEKQLTSRGLK